MLEEVEGILMSIAVAKEMKINDLHMQGDDAKDLVDHLQSTTVDSHPHSHVEHFDLFWFLESRIHSEDLKFFRL